MPEHPAHQPGSGIGDLVWPIFNFLLFVFVLVYFLRGPVKEFFRARAVRLRDALEAGARARAEAAELRAQLARDVDNLPALRERLRGDARAVAERERETLVSHGREAAERIRRDARLVAEQEVTAAREALRAEVIDEAVRQAAEELRAAIRPEDQERFVREFVVSAGPAS